jgi:hypothetical protein
MSSTRICSRWIFSSRAGAVLLLCATRVLGQNAATTVSVDANANQHPISPMIYGIAFPTTDDLKATGFTMNREGGDLSSTYNWQIDATNHANDWYYETFLDPTYDSDSVIMWTRAANVGAQPLLTLPMLGYLGNLGPSNSSLWSFSIKKYGPQTGSDPYQPDAGNGISTASGNPFITGNNPLDANIPNSVSQQQSWINHLIGKWGNAAAGGQKYYIMDNEPSLWSSTHRDVHPDLETYDELYNDYVNYAGALRALDPNAIIVGPEEWSWWALFVSGYDQKNGTSAAGSDYNTHSQTYYYPWLLQQLAAYQKNTGNQLLNVLSVHYYPPELSNVNDDSLSGQLTRNQSTRGLWDPTYVSQSWWNQLGLTFNPAVLPQGVPAMIPTLKNLVSQYYPGLKTAITEYNWYDETKLNGATTQADVLGIFGREGLDLATRWTVPANPSPTYLALEMYRNYDGNLSAFGDTSVSDSVANPDNLSSFAAVRTSDGALTVMVINKQQGTTPVTVSLANFPTTGTAQGFQIASAAQTAITVLGSVPVADNAISVTLPSQSITLFVIPAGTITSKPAPPTGLAANVGSGTITVTWTGGGGATSYTVWRSLKSGSAYVSVGTVLDTAPLTHTDSGLTNGTTYYYVVTATNSAGTSLNSAELAATPIVPPTFTSSATATPNSILPGVSTTIKATVTDTANTLTNGNIQILVQDPNGNTAGTQNYSAQTFAAAQSQNYSFAFTPTIAGTYTVEIGAFSATWQDWYWNASAGTLTVNSPYTFITSTANPTIIAAGATASIALTVNQTGPGTLTVGNVLLQIPNPAGGNPLISQTFNPPTIASGQTLQFSYNWTTAATLPPGSYSINVGIFDSAWTTDYYWNTDATITVTAPLTGTAPALSPNSWLLNFPNQQLNVASGSQTITLTNTGLGPLHITGVAVAGANQSDFAQMNACSGPVAVGHSCTISVRFTPGGLGSRAAAINITDDAAGSPQSLTLTGIGIADSAPPVAAFLDQSGAPALTFNGSTNFPETGGWLNGAPGVAQAPNGDVYVVGLDAAGGVHLNSYSYSNSAWNGWQYSGGILDTTTGLTAAIDQNGVVWFTGRDIGNRFWINSWNGTRFGGWILVADGIFAPDSVPQIAIPSDGSIYVIGKDIGGRIWSNSYIPTSQTLTGWVDRQAVMIGQPSATAGQDGMVYVAVRSVPSQSPVYITQIPAQNAATPNTWLNGGGQIDNDPQISSQGGTVYLAALAGGGTVYMLTFTESSQTWGAWTFTNGIVQDETSAAEGGNVYIAGRDALNRIYWYSVNENSWFFAGGAGVSSTVLTGGK